MFLKNNVLNPLTKVVADIFVTRTSAKRITIIHIISSRSPLRIKWKKYWFYCPQFSCWQLCPPLATKRVAIAMSKRMSHTSHHPLTKMRLQPKQSARLCKTNSMKRQAWTSTEATSNTTDESGGRNWHVRRFGYNCSEINCNFAAEKTKMFYWLWRKIESF